MKNTIDPICGMTVSPETAAADYEYDGTKYYFCSKSCLEKFAAYVQPMEGLSKNEQNEEAFRR